MVNEFQIPLLVIKLLANRKGETQITFKICKIVLEKRGFGLSCTR